MDSASLQFVFFGLIAAIVSNISRSKVWRSVVLFAATALFLALLAHSVFVLLPLFGFLLLGYVFLLLLNRGWSRTLSWMVTTVVLVYIWLKKYTFLPASLTLHSAYLSLGLSYVFFRVLQLLIETGNDRGKRPHLVRCLSSLHAQLHHVSFRPYSALRCLCA